MAYKISGIKNDTARIFVINEANNTLETQVLVSGTGVFEIRPLVAGRKLVAARRPDGKSISYGYINPSNYATAPTVTTQAVLDTTSDGFTCNGDITNIVDGLNATRRGFCYMLGTSGDPTTANSVAYDDGNFGTGAYTKIIRSLWASTNYRARAYASNIDEISYGETVQATTAVYVAGQRGVFGNVGNVINYITISTTANAAYFGGLTAKSAACSSSTRGVFGYDKIDYITISTAGDAIYFGNLTIARYWLAACSSSTRGVFGGGHTGATSNVLDYITIATAGNATDFGDLTAKRYYSAACSSSTRGLFGGGVVAGSSTGSIVYITIATVGTANSFGGLTAARYQLAACSSSTRGVFGGGYSATNVLDYITIATTGNAADFGDLTAARWSLAACSSSTRGVFGGGQAPTVNTIDYITISTLGNATDFGDLTEARYSLVACSDGHGGL